MLCAFLLSFRPVVPENAPNNDFTLLLFLSNKKPDHAALLYAIFKKQKQLL